MSATCDTRLDMGSSVTSVPRPLDSLVRAAELHLSGDEAAEDADGNPAAMTELPTHPSTPPGRPTTQTRRKRAPK